MRIALDGKVALITGASAGIGAACAKAFRDRGALLSLNARSPDQLAAAGGADALVTAGDITSRDVRRSLIERTLERYGRIDILVNNAGRGLYAPLWKVRLEDAENLFALNVLAPLEMMQLAIPHLRAQGGGLIVNIGSIGGRVPLPWLTVYCASKYALGALTDCARMELAEWGIRTMTVCPGYVRTGFQLNALGEAAPDQPISAGAFSITADECAQAIVRGVERGARTVVTPWAGWFFIALERLLPRVVEARMTAIYERLWTSA